jgi:hypothetical protein
MEYDRFIPVYNDNTDVIEKKDELQDLKNIDNGYNKIFRTLPKPDGRLKRTKIEFYTSNGIGTNIRDAETGDYYNNKVGSLDEELFFKVNIATGECTSRNGFSSLFYRSPQHYMSHMKCTLDEKIIYHWEKRYNNRVNEMKDLSKKRNITHVLIN